ncbi:hypothetical protein COU19_00515 [Candidatus Kaiserbacteria bacterium CG10_big_fil_rev_8_21_14_0_10_56_12]|uniref:Glycosyltransferase RgtA/B/C/D-like domain-containing protein n=1 Tax=Candidatus Kaiserbacteria bacterium CG10_big_fil_rev_8_21_14_0_10_56_12 TaxID=1974611 RepID=A0A2H0UAQ8_9BACT|nr:MAG: hypothetical protein COU19_00515 [Candidatus Kaiserbacteria bacterium CG10_big_fil_rev_8_21_14_0_10_56_12]
MNRLRQWISANREVLVLMSVVLVLTSIPFIDIRVMLGDAWEGIFPVFTDESLYEARAQTLVHGHTGGNPYFLEHADGPPLVIFGGAWLNAIPQRLGLPFEAATVLNFILWSLLFALAGYGLLRELAAPPWIAVGGTILAYLESYAHIWRPVNLQPVYPLYLLFYLGLARLIRSPNRRTVWLVGITAGASFYLYAFLWQTVVITLGLLFLYTLARRQWPLMRATLGASCIGGVIGLPVPLYMLWLSFASPYYWESMGRLGLVNTHLPMAEVIYSGGWIGVLLVLLGFFWWKSSLYEGDELFRYLTLFTIFSGLGLWIMQGSNLITGKLLETGEHLRILIVLWFLLMSVAVGANLWRTRAQYSHSVRWIALVFMFVVVGANGYFINEYFAPFLPSAIDPAAWQAEEQLAGPFTWLETHEPAPVVVWIEPRDIGSTLLPVYTKHFTLYSFWGALELVSEQEVRERYLVSQYFNRPTAASLERRDNMEIYLGRADLAHKAGSFARAVRVCKLVFFWDRTHDCGTISTPRGLLGEAFFVNLAHEFEYTIAPHIKEYLAKYHVRYLLTDTVQDTAYRPATLGATLVYTNGRYDLYRLPLP